MNRTFLFFHILSGFFDRFFLSFFFGLKSVLLELELGHKLSHHVGLAGKLFACGGAFLSGSAVGLNNAADLIHAHSNLSNCFSLLLGGFVDFVHLFHNFLSVADGLHDKFRNRLILPVVDVRGDVVGFGSRVIDKSEPKYMNTSETLVYSKRRVLYGLNLAKKTKRPNIILCEGNLDVVTLHQAGFDNAVASMGTALTVEQTRLLSRYTKELILCYDNDNAGQLATQRALEILKNSEFTVRVLQLPRRLVDGSYIKQDADDFIKFQGADAFERLLNGSENGIEFRMGQVAEKYDMKNDADRIAYAAEISQVLFFFNDTATTEIYTLSLHDALPIYKSTTQNSLR